MATYVRFAPLNAHQSVYGLDSSSSNSNHSCPDGVQWIWTVMGDCAVTTREQISAYVGLLSMLTWMMVGIPQIIKNFRNIDGMAGISFFLLFQWTAGDTTNLVGAILTNQLKPQIYLAVFFVMSDCFLLAQYLIFFIRKVRRRRQNDQAISAASQAILCLMGMASFTQIFSSFLTSVPAFGAESSMQRASAGHFSRVLLSNEDDDSLLFRPENQSGFYFDSRHKVQQPAFWHNTKDVVGYSIGCVSSIFYLGSRSSQIYKNYKNQSTEGLAVMMFVLAVVGNITYGGQILIQDLHGEFLLEHTPWLVGSLGVIGLDCTLLWQFHHYSQRSRHLDETRRSLLNHEDCVVNVGPTPGQNEEFTNSLY